MAWLSVGLGAELLAPKRRFMLAAAPVLLGVVLRLEVQPGRVQG
jgi:hypothetical protein